MSVKSYESIEGALVDVAKLIRVSDVSIVSLDYDSKGPPYGIICDRFPLMEDGALDMGEDWWGGLFGTDIVWRFKDNAFPNAGYVHRHLLTVLPMDYNAKGDLSAWDAFRKFASTTTEDEMKVDLPLLQEGDCTVAKAGDGTILVTYRAEASSVRDTARVVHAIATALETDMAGKTVSQQVTFDNERNEATCVVALKERVGKSWVDTVDNLILKEVIESDEGNKPHMVQVMRAISP